MRRRKLLYIPVLLAAIFIYLFYGFMDGFAAYSIPGSEADVIVVLTGGLGRIDGGLMLLRTGRSGKMILSGVNEDVDHDAIFLKGLNKTERGNIILEKRSKSTYENALEVRRLSRELGFDSMILITSSYHMKRAHYLFTRVMPEGVSIEPFQVSSPNFNEQKWWSSLDIVIPEFLKYSWYEVRFGVEDILA